VKFGTVPKVWYFFVFHYFGILAFGERELCVLVLHSAGPDSYLAHFDWSLGIWRTGVMCTYITFCWTRQLSNTTLIGPWNVEDGSYLYLCYILQDQTVI